MKQKILGVIFDMDGVLLDTEKLYNRFWREAAADFGYQMSYEDALAIRSMNEVQGAQILRERLGKDLPYAQVKQRRREIMEVYVDQVGVEKKYGLDELLAHLHETGKKIAVATSSTRERTEKYLTMVGVWDHFDAVVCGDHVRMSKPEPDIYLTAAKALGLPPENCVAVEDSPAGILSANRAGCMGVMVPDLDEPDAETRALAELVVPNLKALVDYIL